jgi:hypothetical protein
MAEKKSRFVLLCQQSLAFGLVAALAAPAASIVRLDIVAPPRAGQPGAASGSGATASAGAPVASRPVTPQVRTVPLRAADKARLGVLRTDRRPTVLSAPQSVDGLATVGVTWARGARLGESAITLALRTRVDGVWSPWRPVPYHQEEAPDPSSAEGRAARPGTDPVYVGDVDDVQVRALTDSGKAPAGMTLSLVDPGAAAMERAPSLERAAADTGTTGLSAARVARRPVIYSRARWGADERMRSRSSLHYGRIRGGFVHHTVNANRYTRAQVPSIIRGIYAYHTQSRGWSDVGYNFLVDRFGRIWEGRYGGVARPVVGAHTLGYNSDSFAMSAIGNYETARPTTALLRAYSRLFAWKLSLHRVRAASTRQWIAKRYLPAISGHRDAGQTACPGRYLYSRIPTIRRWAARHQRTFGGRVRSTNIAGSSQPDIVARDRRTKEVSLIRSGPGGRVAEVTATGTRFPLANLVLNAGDWNRDGHGDVITRSGLTGLVYLYRGNGSGQFSAPVKMRSTSFARARLLAAVGDITGDGAPDLLGQPRGRGMWVFPGNGGTGFRPSRVARGPVSARAQLGIGMWNADSWPDTVLRRARGVLVLLTGRARGLNRGTRIDVVSRGYDWLLAVGDLDGDRRPDLVARTRTTGKLWVLPGARTGFGQRRTFGTGMGRFDLAN